MLLVGFCVALLFLLTVGCAKMDTGEFREVETLTSVEAVDAEAACSSCVGPGDGAARWV